MTNPVEDYVKEKTAAKEQRKKHELQLWQTWKEQGEQPNHLQPLLKLYEPLLAQKVRLWKAPQVPESAFKAELQTHLIKAFQGYDPARGAAINTHVEKRLEKAKRYNNRYQNLAYIPEGQSGMIGSIAKARDVLTDQFGRAPTTDEIADHLSLTPKRLDTILKSVKRDIPMGRSAGAESYDYAAAGDRVGRGFEEQQIAVAQHILPTIFPNKPEMHDLFHYTFGTNEYPQVHSTGDLAKRMGKSESQVSRMKTVMGDTLREHMGLPKRASASAQEDEEEDEDE
jgi:DNA-directed RNA polymerase specialized sigma subunit